MEIIATGRFRTLPHVSRDTGKPTPPVLTKANIEDFLLPLATRYQNLSNPYLAALAGRDLRHTRKRTARLRIDGYLRYHPEIEREPLRFLAGSTFYQISAAGLKLLKERGYAIPDRKPRAGLTHQALIDQNIASCEIGAKADPRIALYLWHEAKDHGLIKADAKPFIPRGDSGVFPDALFVIGREFARDAYLILLEADTGSQSYTVIRDKIRHYLAAFESDAFKAHFGTRKCFVAFATGRASLDTMMSVLAEETADKRSLRKHFIFKHHPLYSVASKDPDKKPRPTGHFLTEPHERVGYPPVIFNQPIVNEPLKEE